MEEQQETRDNSTGFLGLNTFASCSPTLSAIYFSKICLAPDRLNHLYSQALLITYFNQGEVLFGNEPAENIRLDSDTVTFGSVDGHLKDVSKNIFFTE